jgi:hypothetical protein
MAEEYAHRLKINGRKEWQQVKAKAIEMRAWPKSPQPPACHPRM